MKKFIAALLFLVMTASVLAACGGQSGTTDVKNAGGVIRVWVGEESAEFYQTVCDEFVASHSDFGYTIEVKGMNTGSVAGTITTDPQAAADIYTVAHDNIGKLAAKNAYAKPITNQALLDQVQADNPEAFQKVIRSLDENSNTNYVYGVPYISQALFLYYNKALVTEEQAKSFEGLKEAAAAADTKAVTVVGDDGFNMSFALLATKVSDHSTTVKIYEGAEPKQGGSKGTSNCQGDDTVAIVRWLQDYKEDPNGFKWPSGDGWRADFDKNNNGVLAVIGGAWHYKTASDAVGETNLGIALIPTFTLTEKSVEGLSGVKAGDVYRGGTFADCKCFMINSYSEAGKYVKEQELIAYLSSKEVQNKSYLECQNVPAYTGASEFIKSCYDDGKITESQYNLAATQVSMSEWGIPQPFVTGTLNTYYYSKNAPSVLKALVDKTKYPETGDIVLNDTSTLQDVRKGLFLMEFIWMHGRMPKAEEYPAQYPSKA